MNMKRTVATAIASLVLLIGAACSSSSPAVTSSTTTDSATSSTSGGASSTAVTASTRPAASANTGKEMSVSDLVKLADPAIVRIETQGGVGSGFVVSDDGYIVTNNHVVAGTSTRTRTAATIKVTMSDGTDYQAKIVGTDTRTDLAVVKIDATGLKPLKIGSLANTDVGQDVVAIGYALDLQLGEGPSYSVTRGIVSAKNRAISETSAIFGAIQTDAAINHGNSGGPLLNLFGEVVGVNTSLVPDTSTGGTAAGIGLAVGADTVQAVYKEIHDNGKVNRGLLGVQGFVALRPAKAKELGLDANTQGVVLTAAGAVATGGPAANAGMKTGDIITKIGSDVIHTESDLAVALIHNHAGDSIDVQVIRDGKSLTLKVTLGTATV